MEYVFNKRYEEFKLAEGFSLQLKNNELQALLTFEEPSKEEIESVSIGKATIGVSDCMFGIPYSYLLMGTMNPMDCLLIRDIGGKYISKDIEGPLTLTIVLADSFTGEVKALRQTILPNNISDYIKDIMKEEDVLELGDLGAKSKRIQLSYTVKEIVQIINMNGKIFKF